LSVRTFSEDSKRGAFAALFCAMQWNAEAMIGRCPLDNS
jgi:hypothetical protein